MRQFIRNANISFVKVVIKHFVLGINNDITFCYDHLFTEIRDLNDGDGNDFNTLLLFVRFFFCICCT